MQEKSFPFKEIWTVPRAQVLLPETRVMKHTWNLDIFQTVYEQHYILVVRKSQ